MCPCVVDSIWHLVTFSIVLLWMDRTTANDENINRHILCCQKYIFIARSCLNFLVNKKEQQMRTNYHPTFTLSNNLKHKPLVNSWTDLPRLLAWCPFSVFWSSRPKSWPLKKNKKQKELEWKRYEIKNFKLIYLWIKNKKNRPLQKCRLFLNCIYKNKTHIINSGCFWAVPRRSIT